MATYSFSESKAAIAAIITTDLEEFLKNKLIRDILKNTVRSFDEENYPSNVYRATALHYSPAAYSRMISEENNTIAKQHKSLEKSNNSTFEGTRYEHMVPTNVLAKKLLSCKTPEEVIKCMDKLFHVAIIMKSEDDMLSAAGLRSKMPKDWDGESFDARYVNMPFYNDMIHRGNV